MFTGRLAIDELAGHVVKLTLDELLQAYSSLEITDIYHFGCR